MTNHDDIVIMLWKGFDIMLKMTQLSHYLISQHIKKEHLITADFTCGSGEDTAFFATFPNVDKVYSFDLQQEAIDLAKKQYPDAKIQYICDGHEHLDQYLQSFDIGIFNFGYFPAGNHEITTMLETSQKAVNKAIERLNKKGLLLLVLYPGHDEGKKEAHFFESYCEQLNPAHFVIMKMQMMHKPTSPYIIAIEKTRKWECDNTK